MHALPELPEAVLCSILQHISLKQRLSRCAFVCKAWAAAVSATTAHLDVSVSVRRAQAVQSWIDRQAGNLASIHLHHRCDCYPPATLQLHCSNLTKLQQLVVDPLVNLQLHTGQPTCSTRSSRRTSSSTLLLPCLRDVQLRACTLPLQHLKQLSKLTALTRLQLESTVVLQTPYSQRQATEQAVHLALSSVLARLQGLQELTLVLNSWQDIEYLTTLKHISSMQGLKSLKVANRCPAFDHLLPYLPTSLTSLVLSDTEVYGELQAATRLTGLRHFELSFAELDPFLFYSWPSLQHLHLSSILLTGTAAGDGGGAAAPALPAAAEGDDDGDDGNAGVPAAAPPAPLAAAAAGDGGGELRQFLQALQQLTQLQHLRLAEVSLEAGSQAVFQQQHHFSAVVASPKLTSLELAVAYGMPLPLAGLQQLFAPGVRLPSLRVLRLRGQLSLPYDPPEPQLGTDDLANMAAACPGLQELALEGVTAPGAECKKLLSALGPDLQTLRLRCCCLDDAAAAGLPSLRSLRSLALIECEVAPAGLLQLTALSMLTHLKLCGKFKQLLKQHGYCSNVYEMELRADPQAEQPHVWQQLATALSWLNGAGVHSPA